LPEAIASYAQSGDFTEVARVQHSIVATYRDDFNKYSQGNLKHWVQLVFDHLPMMVGVNLNTRTPAVSIVLRNLRRHCNNCAWRGWLPGLSTLLPTGFP
jgi:hypothetical protein